MDIAEIIRSRAAANGVSPEVLARIAKIESNNNPTAAASGSSARGLMQFTAPTWEQYGNGQDPLDPTASADAGARLLRDNATALKTAGIDPTPGALYLSHFAGAGGARKLMMADSNQPVSAVLSESAITANPFLSRMSVGDLKNWASTKMGGEAAPAAATSPQGGAAAQPSSPEPTGMLNTGTVAPPAQDDTAQKAIASLQGLLSQPAQAVTPSPMPQLDIPPPQRRLDPAVVQKMLSSPLRAGFS